MDKSKKRKSSSVSSSIIKNKNEMWKSFDSSLKKMHNTDKLFKIF